MSIDGACRGNGTVTARSAYGVHFAKNSPHNFNGLVAGTEHTNQKAELHACNEGLRKVQLLQKLYNRGSKVLRMRAPVHVLIVKSDSAYLVNGLTDYIDKWRKNGYKSAKGTTVSNADLFKEIDQEIDFLYKLGTRVSFWHVPRMRNREADLLANNALDGQLVD
ncbi:MAG: hypothetical protein LQ352_008211 [Teloschistes flavicans]|nr:MAG: hypothetical protein LQ352_008211 [Teloschistes flavicans]